VQEAIGSEIKKPIRKKKNQNEPEKKTKIEMSLP
jgi:hypothetical protein